MCEWTERSWLDIQEFLKAYWRNRTNRELPEDQLNYLGKKLSDTPIIGRVVLNIKNIL